MEATDRPRYLAIADAIADAIDRNELSPGTRLPTHRDLAYRLGISIHTVSSAYAEAERRGLVVGEIGRGTFVQVRAPESEARFIMDRRHEDLVDLSTNRPIAAYVHADKIRTALSDFGASNDFSALLACRPIAGLDPHRAAGAQWLRRRGLHLPSEQILICNGAAHGLLIALATLTSPGDLVVTESLVDHGIISLASTLHFRLKGLPLDKQGITPEGFEEACRTEDVKVLCATPSLNNPTVSLMSAERRRRIAAIARQHGVAIVEDDVYGVLLPKGPPALSSFAPEQSYYVTSHTKTIMSGLRTGYLAAPEKMMPRLTTRLRATSWMAAPLLAEIATRWINDGTADQLVQWQRNNLAARHKIIGRILAGHTYASQPNSLHIWLKLPPQWRAGSFVSQARVENVAVTPAEPFIVGRQPDPHSIRISVGGPRTPALLEQGLEVLAEMLNRNPEPAYIAD